MLASDDVREATLSGASERVLVLTAANDRVLWVSVTGELFAWDRRKPPQEPARSGNSAASTEGEGPRCLATLGFHPPPHLLAATEDGEVIVFNGAYLGFYALERQVRSPTQARDAAFLSSHGESSAATPQEETVLRELFVVPCRLRGATHLAVSQDGATAAISSPEELVLASCRDLSEAENRDDADPFDAADDGYGSDHEAAIRTAILRVDCTEWFGADAKGGSGCVSTCFITPARLAVLSAQNHIVLAFIDWLEQAVWLERDGHVVVPRKHSVLCMSARHNLIALGCSDGTVKLLQADSLTPFKAIDVVGALEAHVRGNREEGDKELLAQKPWLRPSHTSPRRSTATDRKGPAVAAIKGRKSCKPTSHADNDGVAMTYAQAGARQPAREKSVSVCREETPLHHRPSILDLAVGSKDIVVALPDLVVLVDRDTLSVREGTAYYLHECPLDAVATGTPSRDGFQVACATEGSWVCWCKAEDRLLYCMAAPRNPPAAAADDDIVHASCPLPRTWAAGLEKLQKLNNRSYSLFSSPGTGGSGAKPGVARPAAVVTGNKPVTFGRQIKSSGYGQDIPWSVQQERKRAAADRAKRLAQQQRMGPVPGSGPAVFRRVSGPYEDHRYTPLSSANRVLANDVAVHRSAILSCTFTASGAGVVTTSSSGGYYLKLPATKYKGDGVVLRHTTMHDGFVSLSSAAMTLLSCSANLSLKTPIIATGNADGMIHLWKPCSRASDAGGGGSAARRATGRSFSDDALRAGEAPIVAHQLRERKPVRNVRFFYLDKFLVYSTGADVSFSPYFLDERRRDGVSGAAALQEDLHRFKNDSVLGPPVFTFTADAQQVTSLDCVNHFASSLVVVASSNKTLTVLDITAEAPLRVVKDAHRRSIHKVALAASSASRFAVGAPFSPHGAADVGDTLTSQHLFASAGLDSVVTLWDLRQEKPARLFALHKNVALPTVGLAFDPSTATLAVGSEDRAMYLYDARMSTTALDVVKCGDVPSSIAFHPLEPVLALGLVSGATLLYSQKGE